MDELRKLHDEAISNKPDSMSDEEHAEIIAEHSRNCHFCNDETNDQANDPEGGDMEKTFTQEEVDAEIKAAVAPIQAELDSLKESAAQADVDTRVAAAEEAANVKVADLQEKLEAAVLDASNARAELENVKAYLAAEKEQAELAELAEAIRSSRREMVEQVTSFPKKFIDENIDRWSAESEEDFAARIEEWKISSVKSTDESDEDDTASLDTAMSNVRPSGEEKKTGLLSSYLSASTQV